MSSPSIAVLRAAGLQYARQPINIALFIILPPLFVLALGAAMSTFSDVLGGNLAERTATALAALWAAALLAGSASFFLIGTSRRADERLLIAGLRPGALESAHALGAIVLAVVAGSVGFGFVMATTEIASPMHVWAAIVLGALAYEGVGIALAFGIRGDLEGSFVIILLFMFDAFVAGPLGGASGFWPHLFPLHHPSQLVVDAAVNPDVDGARYVWSIAYTLLLLGLAGLAHRRRLG
jgi:hypothetical protein